MYHFFNKKKIFAFTLAEVLITLGIIGVIAALTMPSLINNYKKKETVTRLKKVYAILTNTMERAKADYGDPALWTFEGVGVDYDNNREETRTALKNMTKKYILPYLADGYSYNNEITSLSSLGYKTNLKYFNGTTYKTPSSTYLPLILNDGTMIFIGTTTRNHTNNDGSNIKTLAGITIHVDINGTKPPNTLGKDLFYLVYPFTSNTKIFFYQKFGFYTSNGNVVLQSTYDELKENCKTKGQYCGALIQSEGWEINYWDN